MRATYVRGCKRERVGPREPGDPLLTPDVVALLGRFTRERGRTGQANAHRVDHLASLARAALCRNSKSIAYFEARRERGIPFP